jgi:predicted nucleic-acid-binding protein
VPDLIVAETVDVLESYCDAARGQIVEAMRSHIAFEAIVTVDPALLLRAIEVYEIDRLDFAEAYLVACAECTGVGSVASFEKSIDRVTTIQRIEPSKPPRRRALACSISVRAGASRRPRASARPASDRTGRR